MTKLPGWKMGFAALLFCIATAIASPAQKFTHLATFGGKNGTRPRGSLVQGIDGDLYGVTQDGGSRGAGTVFKASKSGITTLYDFCSKSDCADGNLPVAGLVQATNENFYGTTLYGGANSGGGYCPSLCGTVFEITGAGKFTTVHSFCSQPNCTDGWGPFATLVQGTDGNLYGTTAYGGANTNGVLCPSGCGTVFKITPSGKLSTLYGFCSQMNCDDGAVPLAGLVQGTDGNFYGTTSSGGAGGSQFTDPGTVFEITPEGQLTTLYSFCSQVECADGTTPEAGIVQGADGNFYGTTIAGGTMNNSGTAFKITPAGDLTTLYSFCPQIPCVDGAEPNGLVQGTDGNFYATTHGGGAQGDGTIFKISAAGTFQTLYNFCSQTNCVDGAYPLDDLLQDTNGTFYGTTTGVKFQGTLFSLSVGLGPFVDTLPGSGNVGAEVGILGNSLTGATSVAFNGISADFTVKLSTLIFTHVPSGATTGYVTVTTPTGVLTSNVPFHVIP